MKGEDQCPFGELGSALLDDSDAAVPVAEREPERAAECAKRLIERKVRIELTAVRQHLGSGADSRERRAYQHLTVFERRKHFDSDVERPGSRPKS